jgi:hypothetical protein
MTEQQTQAHTLRMMHSHYTTYQLSDVPSEGTSDDLNTHIASYLAAGWVLAFYSVVPSGGGTVHHFIWRGPEPVTP